jgi:hypothetical protein
MMAGFSTKPENSPMTFGTVALAMSSETKPAMSSISNIPTYCEGRASRGGSGRDFDE